MTRLVVDSSIVVRWMLHEGEPHREEAVAVLDAAFEERVEIHAPALLFFEVGNALAMKARRLGRSPNARPLSDLFGAPLRSHELDLEGAHRALTLAGDHRLTFYDTTFVVLAERLDCPLVTADVALARPFPRSRVRLLGRDPVPS